MNKIKRYTKSLKNQKKQKACPDLLFSRLTLLKKKTKSYEVLENINLKKSNIEIENQRKIEIRYMFLLKTLDILTKFEDTLKILGQQRKHFKNIRTFSRKHCKKTLQESTFISKTSFQTETLSEVLKGE